MKTYNVVILAALIVLGCSTSQSRKSEAEVPKQVQAAPVEVDSSVVIVTSRSELGPEYRQLVCWGGITVKAEEREKFIGWIKEEFGARAKFVGKYRTLPGDGRPGGRPDILFAIHSEDIDTFAIPRLEYKMRWWEDVLTDLDKRKQTHIIPQAIRNEFPKTW